MKLKSAITRIGLVGLVVVMLALLSLAFLSGSSRRPTNLGAVGGRLLPCPASPNCVCSQADDPQHKIAPLKLEGSAPAAFKKLKDIVFAMPRTAIVTQNDSYLHVEFTTALFRFVDDVEFLVDAEQHIIHFRSASRVGHSDLGTNRRRMEAIRRSFEKP